MPRNYYFPRAEDRMKTNKAWHAKNRMPPKATLKQRAAWHLRHREHCGCREMPKTVLAYLEQADGAGKTGRSQPKV
jgi:hypothetical protein